MPVNVGLAQLSDHFLLATVFFYAMAMLAYAGDFAFGRHGGKQAARVAAVPAEEVADRARVAVGAGVAAQAAAVSPEIAAPTCRPRPPRP